MVVTEEQIQKAFIPPDPEYWIISIPTYGKFVFYGTEGEAEIKLEEYSNWNKTKGYKQKADIKNPKHKDMVRDEIVGIRIDRGNGVDNLPWLPDEGWV